MVILGIVLVALGFLATIVLLAISAGMIWILVALNLMLLGAILFVVSPWPKERNGLPFSTSFDNDCGVYTEKSLRLRTKDEISFTDGSTVTHDCRVLEDGGVTVNVYSYVIHNATPEERIELYGKLGWRITPGDAQARFH